MKMTDLPSGSTRSSESGLVWEEKITAGAGAFKAKFQQTVRVHAIALSTVSLDGVLAITLEVGETEYINVGTGQTDGLSTIDVTITGSANVQLAKDTESGRRTR